MRSSGWPAARGASAITVEASDTAEPFFEARGYVATQRNMVPRDDQWLDEHDDEETARRRQ